MDPSFSPQLCVGFLFLILYPECSARLLCPPASSNTHFLSRIIFHTTHLTHISHRSLSHIIFHTTHLTHIFVHHYLVHHHLCHTSHTHLPHLTHISHMSHIIFHTTHLSHTSLSTTIFVTHLTHISHTSHTHLCPPLSGPPPSLSHISVTPRHFAWQAWHSATSTCHLCGRRGTWRHPTAICVAGVALETLGWVWWRAWTGLVAR